MRRRSGGGARPHASSRARALDRAFAHLQRMTRPPRGTAAAVAAAAALSGAPDPDPERLARLDRRLGLVQHIVMLRGRITEPAAPVPGDASCAVLHRFVIEAALDAWLAQTQIIHDAGTGLPWRKAR